MGISTYFGLDKDIWLNDLLNSLLWTGELVSEARSENGYGKGFLLGQDMENQGHIISTSPVISKIIYSYQGQTGGKTLCHRYIAIHLSTYQSLQPPGGGTAIYGLYRYVPL